MAYVKVSRSKNAIAALRYGEHEKDVVKSGIDCPDDTEVACKLFKTDRVMWNKDFGVEAHVIIQSFDGNECSPQQANEIGRRLAEKVAPGHRAMVYTHTESKGGNVHNHIVIDAVNHENGKKLDDHGFLYECRQRSNEITNELELSNILDRKAQLRYSQAEKGLADKGKQPWKDEIREVVDHAKSSCRDVDEFRKYLNEHGIKINERNTSKELGGKSWTFYHPEGGKVRGSKLGDDYTRDTITASLEKNKERTIDNSASNNLAKATSMDQQRKDRLQAAIKSAESQQPQQPQQPQQEEQDRGKEKNDPSSLGKKDEYGRDWDMLSELEKDQILNSIENLEKSEGRGFSR